ncbi:MAG: hypothetical protein IPF75_03185 [Bacteroidetes bacterium]|nr:hypothetical protein [Bacteroidota bacterium]
MNHLSVSAQTEDNITYKEDIPVLYRREAEGGLTIHSNGFGLNLKRVGTGQVIRKTCLI